MKPIKKCNWDIKKKLNKQALKTPYFLVFLLMILISPLGVYFFVVKIKKDKRKMYIKGKSLIGTGMFIIFLIGIGIYSKVKDIIELIDSGMSLDMIKFLPDNFGLYIIGIIVVISYILGGKELIKRARVEQLYTYRINLEKRENIKELSNELDVPVSEVISNIKLLQKSGYLVPLEVNNKKNQIIYGKFTSIKTKGEKIQKCNKCGALVLLKKDEYNECDFCGNGIIDE